MWEFRGRNSIEKALDKVSVSQMNSVKWGPHIFIKFVSEIFFQNLFVVSKNVIFIHGIIGVRKTLASRKPVKLPTSVQDVLLVPIVGKFV